MMMVLVASSIAYLVGSIPTGYLLAKWYGIQDIRSHGSGNIGATNVARVLGKQFFVIVLLLDFAKAYVVLCAVQSVIPDLLVLPAIALLIGNAYSVFLHFTGGKGAATSLGIIAVCNAWLIAYIAVVWFMVLGLTRTVGIATVAALIALPLLSALVAQDSTSTIGLMVFIAVLGVWLHRNNIKSYCCS